MDEAICSVVMMRGPVVDERHAVAAFWTSIGLLLGRWREGRYGLHVGAQRCVSLWERPMVAVSVEGDDAPEGAVIAGERLACAVDRLARLDVDERRVLATVAVQGVGVERAAGLLGMPVGQLRSLLRSARIKLSQVEVIAGAGRMCAYRRPAILACIDGEASGGERLAAWAHLRACTVCRRAYAPLLRRRPGLPALWGGAVGIWLRLRNAVVTRAGGWCSARLPAPRAAGGGAGLLGGTGMAVKAVVAGCAVIATTAALAGSPRHPAVSSSHHRGRLALTPGPVDDGAVQPSGGEPVAAMVPVSAMSAAERVYREFLAGRSHRHRAAHHAEPEAAGTESAGGAQREFGFERSGTSTGTSASPSPAPPSVSRQEEQAIREFNGV